jgi:hypothetical protein
MQPYIPDIPSILATLSAFVALVVAQFFRDNMIAKVILVLLAGLCAVGAVLATIYNQNQIERARIADQQQHKEIQEQLGVFISEGLDLMVGCGNNNTPIPTKEGDAWFTRINKFLEDRLGHSYAIRLRSPAGVPITACKDADQTHNDFYRIIYALNFHLEQFSQEQGMIRSLP